MVLAAESKPAAGTRMDWLGVFFIVVAVGALLTALNEASKLLGKRVEKGRLTPAKMAEALNAIRPTLSYGDFANVDIVVRLRPKRQE